MAESGSSVGAGEASGEVNTVADFIATGGARSSLNHTRGVFARGEGEVGDEGWVGFVRSVGALDDVGVAGVDPGRLL